MITIRNVTEGDFERIINLNDLAVQETSKIDLVRLGQLVQMSGYCKVAVLDEHVAAFIIALSEGAPYKNDNYNWFACRYPKFLYVDRIVVGSDFSGLKIGSTLYKDMFEFARLNDISVITCEYNIKPPNLPSRAFHDKFGFKEVGTQWVAEGTKLVSLQAAET